MRRSFLSVGHGGFAVEKFNSYDKDGKTYNVVFDCGTKLSKSNIHRQINRLFNKDEEIQKVFISHLHDDHITGLPYLLKYCNVKELYLPYLTPNEQVMTLILLLEAMDYEDAEILQELITGRLESVHQYETRIIYVVPREGEYSNDNDLYARHVSGDPINSEGGNNESAKWVWIPFTYNYSLYADEFAAILESCGINNVKDRILEEEFWENDDLVKTMKKAYNTVVRGQFNLTNMVVYSGLETVYHFGLFGSYYEEPNVIRIKSNSCGCLYMGDYQANHKKEWKELRNTYDKVWDGIGIFTVPHHGSEDNFNDGLIRQGADYIINAKYLSDRHHPNNDVLRELLCNQCHIHWVNEYKESEVCFEYPYIWL